MIDLPRGGSFLRCVYFSDERTANSVYTNSNETHLVRVQGGGPHSEQHTRGPLI